MEGRARGSRTKRGEEREEGRGRVTLSPGEVRRDKRRTRAAAARPVRTGWVGSRFQMGHIWEAVVTLWLPRDQRELWAWPGGAGNLVPRTESLSPSQGGSGHPGSLPGWLDSPVAAVRQGESREPRGWKVEDSDAGDPPPRSPSISIVRPQPHSEACHPASNL